MSTESTSKIHLVLVCPVYSHHYPRSPRNHFSLGGLREHPDWAPSGLPTAPQAGLYRATRATTQGANLSTRQCFKDPLCAPPAWAASLEPLSLGSPCSCPLLVPHSPRPPCLRVFARAVPYAHDSLPHTLCLASHSSSFESQFNMRELSLTLCHPPPDPHVVSQHAFYFFLVALITFSNYIFTYVIFGFDVCFPHYFLCFVHVLVCYILAHNRDSKFCYMHVWINDY